MTSGAGLASRSTSRCSRRAEATSCRQQRRALGAMLARHGSTAGGRSVPSQSSLHLQLRLRLQQHSGTARHGQKCQQHEAAGRRQGIRTSASVDVKLVKNDPTQARLFSTGSTVPPAAIAGLVNALQSSCSHEGPRIGATSSSCQLEAKEKTGSSRGRGALHCLRSLM